ncbi:MAG: hypothetical protein O3C40_36520 [Planctomycetota bacterium]|nr:hypothetical protein [Planctomycetota bacterium]
MADVNNKNLIPIAEARSRLSLVWFVGAGLIFLTLLGASFGNVFAGQLQEVWSASLPTVLPIVSLILSVLGASAIVARRTDDPEEGDAKGETFVRRDFYRLTFGLSIGYLLLILVSFFAHPFVTAAKAPEVTSADLLDELNASNLDGEVTAHEGASAADVIILSNLWLAPVQGLVVGAMGILFFTKKE